MADKDVNGKDVSKKDNNSGAVKKAKKKNSGFKNFVRFIKSVIGEAKKVHWPTAKQLRNNTAIVIAMVLLVGVFVWGIDAVMGLLTNFMISG